MVVPQYGENTIIAGDLHIHQQFVDQPGIDIETLSMSVSYELIFTKMLLKIKTSCNLCFIIMTILPSPLFWTVWSSHHQLSFYFNPLFSCEETEICHCKGATIL